MRDIGTDWGGLIQTKDVEKVEEMDSRNDLEKASC